MRLIYGELFILVFNCLFAYLSLSKKIKDLDAFYYFGGFLVASIAIYIVSGG